jgi:transcriptional regulator with XRE-family HTH domain
MNKQIVKRIKDARRERGLTQKDLARQLGKNAASISDLERGKVQVNASVLYSIAQILDKPLGYFFGEEIGEKEMEDLSARLKKQPQETRKKSIGFINMLLRIQEIIDQVQANPTCKDIPVETLMDFYKAYIPFATAINDMGEGIINLRDKFDEKLVIKGAESAAKASK